MHSDLVKALKEEKFLCEKRIGIIEALLSTNGVSEPAGVSSPARKPKPKAIPLFHRKQKRAPNPKAERPMPLLSAISAVLREAHEPLTPKQVYGMLMSRNYNFTMYAYPLKAVAIQLRRLRKLPGIAFVPHKYDRSQDTYAAVTERIAAS